MRLAFVLAVVGYGTKVGLFPVHTWLPDAHAEAPTPVSALLSGSLLAVSFYAILRYYQISVAALGPRFPQTVLLVFGVASLLLAALYLLEQRDIKRLLAYSSVEHMGILAIGVSFGAPIALSGVLLHVLAHAAAKGNAFMGAGVLVRKFGTKELRRDGATVSGCCPGRGRCFCWLCWRCRRCRRSGFSAANSKSWQEVWPTPATRRSRTGLPGDAGVPGPDRGDHANPVPAQAPMPRSPTTRSWPAVNPAAGWSCLSSPVCWCC